LLKASEMSATPFDNAIAFARDLIRIPSPPGGEEDVANRVLEEYRSLDFHKLWRDEAGNVIGIVEGRGEAPPVMLSCHLDVVDPGDEEAWGHPPYEGAVDGGFLHGRGAMDIKGPLALQTYAAAAFLEGDAPPGDIIVAHTVLEERGGWGMAHLLASGAVEPGVVVIGESTGGDICIGHRGRAEILVEIHGVAGHASAPDRAANALELVPAVLDAVRAFPEERLAAADDVLGRASVAPTQVDVLPASRNVIPDLVRIYLDWRILPDTTRDTAASMVREFLQERVPMPDERFSLTVDFVREPQHTYTGLQQDRDAFTPGFLVRPDDPLPVAAARAVAEATGTEPAIRPWAFATDGGHACGVHGIPAIGYAPGDEAHAHTNVERLSLAEAESAFLAYPPLIQALFEVLAG
jgi:succinyl-diaminopimelate desuccinylase